MPIPKPNKDEKQRDFMMRCVAVTSKEYKREQAVAICYKKYREKDGKY
mgnify:CR=1 FL=1|jgi:hypothetical protein|tara:strand:+ start:1685 stop:1828 length:144 start_codon:yes stop_codon:yes gene_type:complete